MKKNLQNKIGIELCGDLNFEGMVIDITWNQETIASINYEKGINDMEIEILAFGDEASEYVLPLKDFLEVLEKAKKLAVKCAEEDEELRIRGVDF